jgi:hypothetical protein
MIDFLFKEETKRVFSTSRVVVKVEEKARMEESRKL